MVSPLDFESSDPSSNLDGTFHFYAEILESQVNRKLYIVYSKLYNICIISFS